MKKSRFSEEQIIGILKQGEAGVKTAELCREHGIWAATFYAVGRAEQLQKWAEDFDKTQLKHRHVCTWMASIQTIKLQKKPLTLNLSWAG